MNRRRSARSFFVGLLVSLAIAAGSVVHAAGRVALVVGNSTYSAIGPLPNPGNDAADMSAALRRLGFDVTTVLHADRGALTEALRTFTRASAGADVSLVFYAGHGLEVDGVNYLVPVDARLERDTDVRFETVELDYVLAATSGAALRVVILDACRNNPLARSMQRTGASRSVSRGSFGNLDESLLGDETLVAYAAAAGTTAADGTGRNSPYTSALLLYLEQPLEIGLLFRRVRAQVLEATNGEQRPHEYQSLVGEHFLLRGVPGATAVTVEAAAPEAAAPEAAAPEVVDVADVDDEELDAAQLRRAAEQGNASAQTELGERYALGRGVGRDQELAASWFRRAGEQGHAPAQVLLGVMYSAGNGVAQDPEAAVVWYRRAAEQGHPRGQYNLGYSYATGHGVPRDDRVAVSWFRRAAEQGYLSGLLALGNSYRDGRGVDQDNSAAVSWFRRAAERGLAGAQHNLGLMYRDGRGVSQDDGAAVSWIRRAAEQGGAFAQGSLGFMYENGRGVPRDRVEAVRWYRLAAEQGHTWAQEQLDRLR